MVRKLFHKHTKMAFFPSRKKKKDDIYSVPGMNCPKLFSFWDLALFEHVKKLKKIEDEKGVRWTARILLPFFLFFSTIEQGAGLLLEKLGLGYKTIDRIRYKILFKPRGMRYACLGYRNWYFVRISKLSIVQ